MGGSGVQRPLKFIKYLPRFNWHPVVLAPKPGAYHSFDESLMVELNNCDATIERVDAETPFHNWGGIMSMMSKLPSNMQRWLRRMSYGLMLPDNKKGWIEPAVEKGRHLIEEKNIDLIFSTAPPYSNHCIAARLKQDTDLPVVMDFRDEWLESQLIEYPTRWHKRRMARLERETVRASDTITVLDRYMKDRFESRLNNGQLDCKVVPHGFDPEDFEQAGTPSLQYDPDRLNLLYSGIFIHHNQPDSFLKAVKRAIQKKPGLEGELRLHFQGGLAKEHYQLIARLELNDLVKDYGYLTHKQAVANLCRTDAVWFISNFGPGHKQVKSGKLFEYIGSGKPILGLIYDGGEEERLLNRYKASYRARPDDVGKVTDALLAMYKDWKNESLPQADRRWSEQFDRVQLAEQLADLFNKLNHREAG